MFEMIHYTTRNSDGSVHVTNFVAAFEGQHHVHTAKDFTEWAKGAGKIREVQATNDCECGLTIGETREGPHR